MMKQIMIKDYFNEELNRIKELNISLSLLIVDVTEGDPANQIYIKKKVEDCSLLGWKVKVVKPKNDLELLTQSCEFPLYDCIICQMPLADNFTSDIKRLIPREKDCDGLSIDPIVSPATARGIIDYLDTCEFEYEGKTAIVLGRSEIVGKPIAKMLLDKNMTIIQCHSKTPIRKMFDLLYEGDLIISATGRPHLFSRREISPNTFVVDVGIARENGKLVGDFDEIPYFCTPFGAASTPVPGGVGLLTRLGLIKNCIDLKKWSKEECINN